MKRALLFITSLCLMAFMTISCSDNNNVDPEPPKSSIVGEWQLLKKSFITIENGEAGAPDETEYSGYSKQSILLFTGDGKFDFKVYEKGQDGELELEQQTGKFVEEGGKMKLTFTYNSNDGEEETGITFDTYKIEGNTLTFTTVEGTAPLIIKGTFTAKKIK